MIIFVVQNFGKRDDFAPYLTIRPGFSKFGKQFEQ